MKLLCRYVSHDFEVQETAVRFRDGLPTAVNVVLVCRRCRALDTQQTVTLAQIVADAKERMEIEALEKMLKREAE